MCSCLELNYQARVLLKLDVVRLWHSFQRLCRPAQLWETDAYLPSHSKTTSSWMAGLPYRAWNHFQGTCQTLLNGDFYKKHFLIRSDMLLLVSVSHKVWFSDTSLGFFNIEPFILRSAMRCSTQASLIRFYCKRRPHYFFFVSLRALTSVNKNDYLKKFSQLIFFFFKAGRKDGICAFFIWGFPST